MSEIGDQEYDDFDYDSIQQDYLEEYDQSYDFDQNSDDSLTYGIDEGFSSHISQDDYIHVPDSEEDDVFYPFVEDREAFRDIYDSEEDEVFYPFVEDREDVRDIHDSEEDDVFYPFVEDLEAVRGLRRGIIESLYRLPARQEHTKLECSICIEKLKPKETLVLLECSHHFHESCVLKWFESKNSCPLCRYPLTND